MSRYRRDAERRLEHVLGLSPERAARAVSEVLDSLSLDVADFIAERHTELQREGVANPEIYERIAREIAELRFRAPALSARQIRRRIYG